MINSFKLQHAPATCNPPKLPFSLKLRKSKEASAGKASNCFRGNQGMTKEKTYQVYGVDYRKNNLQ